MMTPKKKQKGGGGGQMNLKIPDTENHIFRTVGLVAIAFCHF